MAQLSPSLFTNILDKVLYTSYSCRVGLKSQQVSQLSLTWKFGYNLLLKFLVGNEYNGKINLGPFVKFNWTELDNSYSILQGELMAFKV